VWDRGWREQAWSQLDQSWDLIIIGGGITGAGILYEATQAGYKALLVEAADFASGTSSRSSKMVHGGIRYLRNAQFKLTYESVRERELLLRQARGLVHPLRFVLTNFEGDAISSGLFGFGLAIYDIMRGRWDHERFSTESIRSMCPQVTGKGLLGGYRYLDAKTDDARLVLRLMREAVRAGGMALNYASASALLRSVDGTVHGIVLQDRSSPGEKKTEEVRARAVVNATGPWADELRAKVDRTPQLRLLRGSHLIFPSERLPLDCAISFLHPSDGRPIYVLPWEGTTLYGTTDLDHKSAMADDVGMSGKELDYLMSGARRVFPELHLEERDILSSFSGVRAVVDTGKTNPSKESREHVFWFEHGLLTVTGGKLTTFRVTAQEALKRLRGVLPAARTAGKEFLAEPSPPIKALDPMTAMRYVGRYGIEATEFISSSQPEELRRIEHLPASWAELRWAARTEGAVHLQDLLLRRVRIGLTLPMGAMPWMERIQAIVQEELGWDSQRWQRELLDYQALWKRFYHLPN
jgi:glycerol-3-phosphate dehydrogenase